MSFRTEEPVALIGASITLPANIHSRERFFEVVRDQSQVSVDTVAAGRYHASDIDEGETGHPWKLKSKYSMVFTEEELNTYDTHLFNIQGKVARNMHPQQLGVLQSVFEGLEDAGIPLHEIYRTRTGVFVAAYTAFLPAADGPDETLLRGQIMSSLADQVRALDSVGRGFQSEGCSRPSVFGVSQPGPLTPSFLVLCPCCPGLVLPGHVRPQHHPRDGL